MEHSSSVSAKSLIQVYNAYGGLHKLLSVESLGRRADMKMEAVIWGFGA